MSIIASFSDCVLEINSGDVGVLKAQGSVRTSLKFYSGGRQSKERSHHTRSVNYSTALKNN